MIEFTYKEMKFVALSDTHGGHRNIVIPPCDILIHAGDVCTAGEQGEISDFFKWLSEQPAKHKIFVSGNHDLPFELNPERVERLIPDNVVLLNNRVITIEHITIAGIWATPGLLFDVEINEPIDIIVSHGAPKDILDEGVGCQYLGEQISRAKPSIAVFGHFHKCGGQRILQNGICYMNVAETK